MRSRISSWIPFAMGLAASAPMIFWGTGLRPVWWLMWIAPLPLLLVAPRYRGLQVFFVAATAWFLGSLNLRHFAHSVIGLPLTVILVLLVIPSCVFGLAVLVHRRFVRRGDLWKASFAFPILWVAYEFLNAAALPDSSFGILGYTQMDLLPVIQVASLVGIWGISFCVF